MNLFLQISQIFRGATSAYDGQCILDHAPRPSRENGGLSQRWGRCPHE